MKTVEETHPSLKRVKTLLEFEDDFSALVLSTNIPNICKPEFQNNNLSCSTRFVLEGDVVEHTIDKQVLKDILKKHKEYKYLHGVARSMIEALEEELGLGDKQ
jgi:hypothetical protein